MTRPHRNPRHALPIALALTAAMLNNALQAAPPPADTVLPRVYHEAPELADRVADGELPPVAERMPDEPLVVEPVEETGVYGGQWRRMHLGPKDAFGATYLTKETLLQYSVDYSRIVCNVARGYQWSDDYRTLRFDLRPGMKWSDGAPFTADDFLFWYEAEILNDELTPGKPEWLMRGGELARMAKIDDYAFELRFAEPYGALTAILAGLWNPELKLPAHYMKRYHPDFTPMDEIEREMAKGGFDEWMSLFGFKASRNPFGCNPDCPTISAWQVRNDLTSPVQQWSRNPYYWKVDPAGNQLPYLDGIQQSLASDPEKILIAAIAGKIDLQARRIGGQNVQGIDNYPLLMEKREKGQYRVILRNQDQRNSFTIFFNFHTEDPVLHDLFWNRDFRVALSVAIDRHEINEFFCAGLGAPSQVLPVPESPWYEDEVARLHTEFDLDRANRLLDGIGLAWNEDHTVRLRRDGSPLLLVLQSVPENVEAMELVKEYWDAIGVRLAVKPIDSQQWYAMIRGGTYELTSYLVNTAWTGRFPINSEIVPLNMGHRPAPQWGLWINSEGRAGEEPPDWVKEMVDLYEKIMGMPPGSEQDVLIREVYRLYVDNLMTIGILRNPRYALFAVVRNDFRNVPDPLPNQMCVPTALYFKKPGVLREEGE